MINSVCILGGGNAGLMSALMLRSAFPMLDIKLIKSSKIPTIGVGEGSTEHWTIFADMVGITAKDIIDNAGATIKHGIQFNDWSYKGDLFFHSLPEFLSSQDQHSGLPYNLMHLIAKKFPAKDLVWNMSKNGYVVDPMYASSSQYHFDSLKLNSYLENLCKERSVKIVEDTIINVKLTEEGYVDSLVSEKDSYTADFYIDNSGFERIIAKKLSIGWKSYSKYLPVNAAFAFPSQEENEISTHTKINGRSHGWSWKAPVQGRNGNGYVYCSEFTPLEIALEEIQKDYPEKINIAKEVKFVAGHTEKFWSKNCVSMGLAGSFIEPLEASNIATTIQQCRLFISSIVCWTPNESFIEKKYNKIFDQVSQNILDYVQLHYLNGRTDSKFWEWCQNDMTLTDFNKETLGYFKNNFVNYNFFHNNIYELYDELDWIQLMYGLNMFNVDRIGQLYSKNFYHLNSHTLQELSNVVNTENTKFYKHKEAIQMIRDWKND